MQLSCSPTRADHSPAQNNEQLTPAQKSKSLAHYANMHAVLALTEILYLPADGRGEGLVAEEILDWVNTVDKGEF